METANVYAIYITLERKSCLSWTQRDHSRNEQYKKEGYKVFNHKPYLSCACLRCWRKELSPNLYFGVARRCWAQQKGAVELQQHSKQKHSEELQKTNHKTLNNNRKVSLGLEQKALKIQRKYMTYTFAYSHEQNQGAIVRKCQRRSDK